MLSIDQVKEKAPAMVNYAQTYAFRRLWCLINERTRTSLPGTATFQQFKVDIGDKHGELLPRETLAKLQSDNAIETLTQLVNNSLDTTIDKVFSDDKSIYDYIHLRNMDPDFTEPIIEKLDS